jgi:anaerobic ribonucleoside-triphosphate reductase
MEVLSKSKIKEFKNKYGDDIFCHVCGYRKIILVSDCEGYWCPKCGSSDSDE